MSFIKTSGIRGLNSNSNDLDIHTDGSMTMNNEMAFTNTNMLFGTKNLILNGDFRFWQRSTNATGITTTSYHAADRFRLALSSMGTWSETLSTDVPNGQFLHSAKLTCTTADSSPAASDLAIYQQWIEGGMCGHIAKGTTDAKKLTLSFWVKSNITGTFICELYDTQNTRACSKSYTIDTANTWEKKALTFPADTSGTLSRDTNGRLVLQMWLGAGSDHTSGTLQTTWSTATTANRVVGQTNLAGSTNNEIYFTGIQLEAGSHATAFEFLPYYVQQAQMHRYYFRPTNGSYGWSGRRGGGRFFRVNNRTQGTLELPVTMRASPSFFASRGYGDGNAASLSVYAGNGWSSPASPNFVNYEANFDPNSGSGNGGTFGVSVYVTAEIT